MSVNDTEVYIEPELRKGYQPKGFITKVLDGKPTQIPVSKLKINPPKSGTAAVTPKK